MASLHDKPSAIDRLIQSTIGEGREVGAMDDPAKQKYPELWKVLSTIYVGRDWIKTPATLTIKLGPGGVVLTLTDRDLRSSKTVLCRNLEDMLKALEADLNDMTKGWTTWGKGEPQLKKRRGGG